MEFFVILGGYDKGFYGIIVSLSVNLIMYTKFENYLNLFKLIHLYLHRIDT